MRALIVSLLLFCGSLAMADGRAPRNVGYKFIPKATAPENCGPPYLCLWMPSQGVFANQLVLRYNGTDAAFATATNPIVYNFSDPAYVHTLHLGSVTTSTWLKIAAGDPGRYVDFYGTFHSFAAVGGAPYRDDTVNIGMNCASGGGPVIAGRMALCLGFESYFRGGHDQNELHIYSISPSGVQTRLWSSEQHIEGSTALYLAATTIAMGSGINSSAPAQLNLSSTTTIAQSPSLRSKILVDDTANPANTYVNIQTGLGGSPTASINLDASSGSVRVSGNGVSRLYGAGNIQLEWDSTTVSMLSPNQTNKVQVSDDVLYMVFGGQIIFVGHATAPRFATGLGMYNVTPPASQPSTTGESAFTNGGGAAVSQGFCSTGGVGTKCYTLGDIVKHLKALGHLATN